MTDKPKKQHGGARKGAGRPRKPDARRSTLWVVVSAAELADVTARADARDQTVNQYVRKKLGFEP